MSADFNSLKAGSHIHLMGICGTAMGSLAGLLVERGFKVTGSDQNVYPPMSTQLERLGIVVMEGYKRENLSPRPDLVIVGNVISRQFDEAQALLEAGIPYTSLPAAMGELVIGQRHSVVVAGTHGKTTTTSMMAWILTQAGLNPGFLIGGIPKNFGRSYCVPKGDWFVIEGDEYDTAFFDKVPKFVHYRPRSAILTSVEFDHADIYRDLEHVKQAFLLLLERLPANGRLVASAEDENIADLLRRQPVPQLITFGIDAGTYQARAIEELRREDGSGGTSFEAVKQGTGLGRVETQAIGLYNVKNALAALAMSEALGIPRATTIGALGTFAGVKRRQEVIGRPNGIALIEDFAHHPTAVKGTIEAVQKQYPKGRVFSIFEPRSATSRRKVFQRDYVEAFAQVALFPPPYDQAKIAEGDRFSIDELVRDLRARGVDAAMCASVDDIVARVRERARPGDAVLIMSNGGFGGIYQKLIAELGRS
jgi:UDP-N-acetylmuramate: L-alanyl-gamma-D-glutamyl-meso-diaminopimelate ligase